MLCPIYDEAQGFTIETFSIGTGLSLMASIQGEREWCPVAGYNEPSGQMQDTVLLTLLHWRFMRGSARASGSPECTAPATPEESGALWQAMTNRSGR